MMPSGSNGNEFGHAVGELISELRARHFLRRARQAAASVNNWADGMVIHIPEKSGSNTYSVQITDSRQHVVGEAASTKESLWPGIAGIACLLLPTRVGTKLTYCSRSRCIRKSDPSPTTWRLGRLWLGGQGEMRGWDENAWQFLRDNTTSGTGSRISWDGWMGDQGGAEGREGHRLVCELNFHGRWPSAGTAGTHLLIRPLSSSGWS